jgi:hypothetical protein
LVCAAYVLNNCSTSSLEQLERQRAAVMDKFLNSGVDWLETSRMPPLFGALLLMAFALRCIWLELK